MSSLTENTNNFLLKCLVCGHCEHKTLHVHLRKAHQMTSKMYYDTYNVDSSAIYSDDYREKLRAGGKAGGNSEKNPFRNHGGKMSPFSSKFIKYDGDHEKALAAIHAVHSKRDNAGNNCTQLSYWIKRGLPEEDAKIALNDRQTTFSLAKAIMKYGQIDGHSRWLKRQDKWMQTLLSKPLEEIERINNLKLWRSGGVSKQSIRLFTALDLPEARWSNNGGEVCIPITIDGKLKHRMVDFMLGKKAIEYFGGYWHADPRFYHDNAIIFKRSDGALTAKAIREKDAFYLDKLREYGFDVHVVWEKDFIERPEEVITQCKLFLQS